MTSSKKNIFILTAIAAAALASGAALAQSAPATESAAPSAPATESAAPSAPASSGSEFVNPDWANSAWYVGAGIGQSRANLDDKAVAARLTTAGGTVNDFRSDERDVGYKLFMGKQLNRNFAIEAGFFDLGKFNYHTKTVQGGELNGELRYKGINLDLIGQMFLTERFSAYGRAGMNYAKSTSRFSGNRLFALTDPKQTEKKLKPHVGLGLEYKFTEALALRGEVERFHVRDALRDSGKADLYSLSLVYKLGRPVAAPVAYVPPVAAAPAPAPVVEPAPAPAPAPEPVPVSEKVSFAAEALFDTNKAVVKPEGKAALDELLNKMQGMNTEVMVTVGHADSVGSNAHNDKLSLRRAEAVKAYIVSKGVETSRVYTEGKGETQPVADNKTAEGRAKNRRVTVEVVGTRTTTK